MLMKYRNITDLLPPELVSQIQDYIQGEYIYIPIRERDAEAVPTDYKVELQKRDEQIYLRYLEGISRKRLAVMYHLSEPSIRRIILKQRGGYRKMQGQIMHILKYWKLESEDVKQIYTSAWLVGEQYVLKVYDDCVALERNIKILKALAENDIPVAKVISTKEGTSYVEEEGVFFVLTARLPGSNLVQFDKEPSIATQMGWIIGDLHAAFRTCEKEIEFWDNSLLDELKGWIRATFEKNNWEYVSKEGFEALVKGLEALYDNLPRQLIHRDVHFGNFLFDKGNFSGYIDFDLSQRNIRIFDLCYFLLGLLSEEEKLELTKAQWFEIVKKTLAGYEKISPLNEAEKKAIPLVMEAIELLFVAWFANNDNVRLAKNALQLYEFVKEHEEVLCVI